jgi:glycosyltransferase involved in cell wall biosynthesis
VTKHGATTDVTRISDPKRGFLVLGIDISRTNGVGAFTAQILEGLGRIAPGVSGTALAMSVASDLDVPGNWNVYCARGRSRYATLALVLAVRQRPSQIVVMHLSLLPAAWLAANLVGARLTLVAHGIEISSNRRRLNLWCGYRVDQIAANSRITALKVERLFRDERARRFGAVQLLYPTWDHRNSIADQTRRVLARAEFGFGPDETVLLTVGRLDSAERYKGHDRVLDALPMLLRSNPGVRYLIAGQGDDKHRLVQRARDLGVAPRVTFAGYVENVADCYAACDVYVMPSTGEGFGIVFLEALASGCPVVCGGIDGSIEAVGWGELAFLCDPLTPGSVERTIRRAIDALGGPDPRVDDTFLRTNVEVHFGAGAFDRRLSTLLEPAVSDSFDGAN